MGVWWLDEKAPSQTFWKAPAAYPHLYGRMGKTNKMTPSLTKTHQVNQRTVIGIDDVYCIILCYVYEIK